jgi:uncharacterized protein
VRLVPPGRRGRPGRRAQPATGWTGIEPRLYAEPYVFVSVPEPPPGLEPFAVIREDEGVTLVMRRDDADRAGLGYGYVAARITLAINSALDAVGLTAVVSRTLADAGISCNIIAGAAHDHLFVDWRRGPEAAALLGRL